MASTNWTALRGALTLSIALIAAAGAEAKQQAKQTGAPPASTSTIHIRPHGWRRVGIATASPSYAYATTHLPTEQAMRLVRHAAVAIIRMLEQLEQAPAGLDKTSKAIFKAAYAQCQSADDQLTRLVENARAKSEPRPPKPTR